MALPKEAKDNDASSRELEIMDQMKNLHKNPRFDLEDKLSVGCCFNYQGSRFYICAPTQVLKFVRIPAMIVPHPVIKVQQQGTADESDILKINPPLKPGDLIPWRESWYLCLDGFGIKDVTAACYGRLIVIPSNCSAKTTSK